MIFKERSERMLKYEKSKAKLVEFDVKKEDYPKFPMNSDDLVYTTLFVLSRYCEELIVNPDSQTTSKLFMELTSAAQYYNAAVNSKQWLNHDHLFLLLGATAYFLSEDFGSAKVLISRIDGWRSEDNLPSLLYFTLCFLLLDTAYPSGLQKESHTQYAAAITQHFRVGTLDGPIFSLLSDIQQESLFSPDVLDITYADFLYGVSFCALRHSAWLLLPRNSRASTEKWGGYLSKSSSVKLLWPAQKIIVEAGALRGQDLIIPFPTGVGKTKSIELIIRSVFMEQGRRVALVVAPLRALCNEITQDLTAASMTAVINQFSDTAQEDFNLELQEDQKYILICTPEKFTYILRHQPDVLPKVDLFIFDEAHLFDDDTRGVQYELLVSEIVRHRSKSSQIVLFSAVLSNAGQISNWLFPGTDTAIDHSLVKSTEKSIGFLSSDQIIHYYGKDDMAEENFFVPKSIQISSLQRFGKERKVRYFPEGSAQDYAIYYGIKLCGHGGAAIFAGQVRSISAIMKRFLDIARRGYDLSNLRTSGNQLEIAKLQRLFQLHYGPDSELTKSAGIGVFPHYARLPNGVKLSVEYALRKRDIHLVVCTTTLAEGVNIPIKYLLLTTFSNGNSTMQIRKMQNLIGRTARSGIYTEGSAIITDTNYFDNRKKQTGGENYKWTACKKMFDCKHTEPCGSAILRLVSPLEVDYGIKFKGKAIAKYFVEHYGTPDCFASLKKRLKAAYQQRVPLNRFKKNSYVIEQKVDQLENILEDIENYLCYIYHEENRSERFDETVNVLSASTFAFHLAEPEKQKSLQKIFLRIADRIRSTVEERSAGYFAKSLYGLQISQQILQWTQENAELLEDSLFESPLDPLIELFLRLFSEKSSIEENTFKAILQGWIAGKLYIEIYQDLKCDIPVADIERLCASTISYDFSFFIGNIVDAAGMSQELAASALTFLQKQVKYGVPSYFQVLICENIFDDRYLAKLLEKACDCPDGLTSVGELKQLMQKRKGEIFDLLDSFPKYFAYRFKIFIE